MPLIVVPHLPMSGNQWSRKHWSVRNAEKDRWRNLLFAYGAKRAKASGMCVSDPAEVWITFYWGDRRRHDADNGVKLILDAAVHHGLISDDSYPALIWTHTASRVDKERPRVEFRWERVGESV